MTDPAGLAIQRSVVKSASPTRAETQSMDSHLRSTKAVAGYYIDATDGEIGHVEDFIIDHDSWIIRYIEMDTRNWWPGKKVLISPRWIERVSWADSKVYVNLSQETIKSGPEYFDSVPITREYESQLYDHYKQAAYWLPGTEQPHSHKVSKA
jgi:hypothetical protein